MARTILPRVVNISASYHSLLRKYVDSGFGVEANSRGRACYGWDLYRRKRVRINRPQVLGIVPEDKLPDFAKKTLADIQSGVLKEEYDSIKKKEEGER